MVGCRLAEPTRVPKPLPPTGSPLAEPRTIQIAPRTGPVVERRADHDVVVAVGVHVARGRDGGAETPAGVYPLAAEELPLVRTREPGRRAVEHVHFADVRDADPAGTRGARGVGVGC